MCILGLLLHASRDIPFLAVHNRDEFFRRAVGHPALGDDGILFARDAAGGGTWLGLNTRTGVFAALTNVRDRVAPPPSPASRGQLVLAVLRGDGVGGPTLAEIRAACDAATAAAVARGEVHPPPGGARHGVGAVDLRGAYAGFNLLVAQLSAPLPPGGGGGSGGGEGGAPPEAFFLTNRPVHAGPVAGGGGTSATSSGGVGGGLAEAGPLPVAEADGRPPVGIPSSVASAQRVGAGCHALSNSTLDDAGWGKVVWVRQRLGELAPSLPLLGELRQRAGQPWHPPGRGHASDMGVPATARAAPGPAGCGEAAEGGGGGGAHLPVGWPPEHADAAAHRALPRQHAGGLHEGDADMEAAVEAALVQDALTRVAGIM